MEVRSRTLLAITALGDEIILTVPFNFNHEMAIQMADCRAVCVATTTATLRAAVTMMRAPRVKSMPFSAHSFAARRSTSAGSWLEGEFNTLYLSAWTAYTQSTN